MLRHEQLQSKETASVVMNKIMAAGGPDVKVHIIFLVELKNDLTDKNETSDQCSY